MRKVMNTIFSTCSQASARRSSTNPAVSKSVVTRTTFPNSSQASATNSSATPRCPESIAHRIISPTSSQAIARRSSTTNELYEQQPSDSRARARIRSALLQGD